MQSIRGFCAGLITKCLLIDVLRSCNSMSYATMFHELSLSKERIMKNAATALCTYRTLVLDRATQN